MTGISGPARVARTSVQALWICAVITWLAFLHGVEARQRRRDRGGAETDPHWRDRGDVLATTALTVGLVLLAGAILFALRGKADTIVSNVCTNADPSTC